MRFPRPDTRRPVRPPRLFYFVVFDRFWTEAAATAACFFASAVHIILQCLGILEEGHASSSSCYSIYRSRRHCMRTLLLTGSESRIEEAEAAVLDGVGRLITNEGLGLGDTEEETLIDCG